MQTTEQIIEEIHNAFRTEGDRLLDETKRIIKSDNTEALATAERLKALGFSSTLNVREANHVEFTKKNGKQLIARIQYYNFHYPQNRFITEDGVQRLCEKYNLICGTVGRYKGTVPMENLNEMERFKVREEDVIYRKAANFRLFQSMLPPMPGSDQVRIGFDPVESNEFITSAEAHKEIAKIDVTSKIRKKERDSSLIDYYTSYILGSEAKPTRHTTFSICAPEKDFDTSGRTEVRNRKLIEIPDPVVLYPVMGGYLIVTAWGLEAKDESVINPNKN